jgi:hypothetical protein
MEERDVRKKHSSFFRQPARERKPVSEISGAL